MKKAIKKKLVVGDWMCGYEEEEMDNSYDTPATIKTVVTCKYMDRSYAAIKCKYDGNCYMQEEVLQCMVKGDPGLFEEAL